MEFERSADKPQLLLKGLLEAKQLLQLSHSCLKVEPSCSPVADLLQIVKYEMVELDPYIEMVEGIAK